MYNKMIKLPINSSKEYMQNKKCDYKILALLTLYSELNDDYRFLYYDDLIKDKNIKNIEKISNLKIKTIKDKIRYFNKNISDLIHIEVIKDSVAIIINYSTDNKEYVTIEEDILKLLINKFDSATIKIYILLKYLCLNQQKAITNNYIIEQIGLSSKSNKNSSSVTDRINNLIDYGLIKKFKNKKAIKYDGFIQIKIINSYSVSNYSQWYTYMLNNKLDIMKELDMNIGSKGELAIADYLDNKSVNYIREHSFKDLKGDKGLLRFDFYLPDENILIEFDGKQHDKYVKFMHKNENNFDKLQKYDKKKIDYAKKNNIKLIRIGYDDIENIDSILEKEV